MPSPFTPKVDGPASVIHADDINLIQDVVDGKPDIVVGTVSPANPDPGDQWMDTSDDTPDPLDFVLGDGQIYMGTPDGLAAADLAAKIAADPTVQGKAAQADLDTANANIAHVDPGAMGTRSVSMRGHPNKPFWFPSEVVVPEDYKDILGSTTDSYINGTFDNSPAIPQMISDAKIAGNAVYGSTGTPIGFGRAGVYGISQPIVLPRTGTTPTNVVPVIGLDSRTTSLRGLTNYPAGDARNFPSGRGMIEWEATISRAWCQRIENLRFNLPNVDNVCAIWHKKIGPGTTSTDYSNEWLSLSLRNIHMEGSNQYVKRFLMFEVGNRFARFENVVGDPSVGTWVYDTYLVETASQLGTTDPPIGQDSVGFQQVRFVDCLPEIRKGGLVGFLKGRFENCIIESSFENGGVISADFDLANSSNPVFISVRCEGLSERPQWKLRRCWGVQWLACGVGGPNTTTQGGSALGNGVEMTDCHDCHWDGRAATPGAPSFSSGGTLALTMDANCSDNTFERWNVNATAGAEASEMSIAGVRNTVSGVGISGSASAPVRTPYSVTV